MALTCLTGNGTTLTIPGDLTASVISIGSFSQTYPDINVSTLATTAVEEMCPGDLLQVSEIPVTIALDPGDAGTNLASTLGVVGTITITFSNSDTLSGTGYVKAHGFDGIANNERIEGTLTLQFDGDTGPAWANTP